jgi:hypothetical protein
MIDAATAVQDAVYTALNVPALTASAEVFAHVPEATDDSPLPDPFVLVGDISLEPQGGKDGGLDLATVEIIILRTQADRAALSILQAIVRSLLDGQPIAAAAEYGALLSPPVFLSSDGELLENGVTYMGTQQFQTFVQPA